MSVLSTIYGTGIKYNYIDRGFCAYAVFSFSRRSGTLVRVLRGPAATVAAGSGKCKPRHSALCAECGTPGATRAARWPAAGPSLGDTRGRVRQRGPTAADVQYVPYTVYYADSVRIQVTGLFWRTGLFCMGNTVRLLVPDSRLDFRL